MPRSIVVREPHFVHQQLFMKSWVIFILGDSRQNMWNPPGVTEWYVDPLKPFGGRTWQRKESRTLRTSDPIHVLVTGIVAELDRFGRLFGGPNTNRFLAYIRI